MPAGDEPTGTNSLRDTQTNETLADRLRRLEAAVEAAGLGVWEWDVRTGAVDWNARNRELFGAPANGALTIDDYMDLVHPDDREKLGEDYRAVADRADGGDFTVEYRTSISPGGKTRWVQTRGRILRDAAGVARVAGSTLDITDRRSAEERRNLLLRELAHRAKNGILVMMAIVAQTARGASTVQDFEAVLTARLRSMADSTDMVTEAEGRPLPLADIIARALTPFDRSRFEVDPGLTDLSVPNDLVVALALLLHELSTNAMKYGALSAPAGRVKLRLAESEGGRAILGWTETGGPPVKPTTRKGFGTRLLEVSLRANGGHVEAMFDPRGFQATIHFPVGP